MQRSIRKVLITGGNGNLGRLAASRLLEKGVEVVKFDIPGTEPGSTVAGETIIAGDMRDTDALDAILAEHKPDTIYHLASLLSGSSEASHIDAWEINATASFHLLRLAIEHHVETFFFASTNASYGSSLQEPLPEDAEQWPENIYGATKVAVERLGVFYKLNKGLDFRCLRFPMVLSPYAPPTAVTAFPSRAFRAAVNGEVAVFPVAEHIGMSNIFLEDVVSSIVDFNYVPRAQVKQHVYNLHAYYMSAGMVIEAIRERYPEFEYRYEPDATVERLLANWPDVVLDDNARADWGWRPRFDFLGSVERMWHLLKTAPLN